MDLQMLVNTVKVASQAAGLDVSGGPKFKAAKQAGSTLMTAKNINKINSIKGKARESIAQYPVLVSENLNPKLVPILTNALEVEYASLVWLLISNESSFQSGGSSSVINQFHRAGSGLKEETFLAGVDSVHQLYEANKELLQPYEESLNMKTLNESYYTGSIMEYLSEANKSDSDEKRKDAEFGLKKKQDAYKKQRDLEADRRADAQDDYKRQRDAISDARTSRQDTIGYAKTSMDMLNTGVNIATNISRELDRKKDRAMTRKEFEDDQAQKRASAGTAEVHTTMKDLVKVNDLHPTILNIEVNFIEPGTDSVVKKKISLGIKCVSHLLKSDDIQYYLTRAAYKNSGLLKLIKWTTGEIKFWKDLILTLDDIKLSAVQNAKTVGNKNYFSKLEYIAKTAKHSVLAGSKSKNVPSAITTLIITKTDVENIKYRDGVNILANPEYLKKIFETYYLLNLLIVDESLDVVYNYDQFKNTINRQPFSSYEKNSKERVINANDLYKLSNL